MNVDVAPGNGYSFPDLSLDAELRLLCVGVAVARLAAEEHRERRNRSGMCDGNPKLREIGRSYAGGASRCRGRALNLSLGKERLEDGRGSQRRISRSAGKGHKDLSDLAESIDEPQSLHHVGDLPIDGRVEDSVPAADHRLVVVERIPGKGDARREVVFVRVERTVLRVDLIADAKVERKVWPEFPGVLPEAGAKGSGVVIDRIGKTLLIELRQPQRNGLERVEYGRSHSGKSARRRHSQAGAEERPRQTAEDEAPGEKGMRLAMISSIEKVATHLHGMVPADHREVVRRFVTTGDR